MIKNRGECTLWYKSRILKTHIQRKYTC